MLEAVGGVKTRSWAELMGRLFFNDTATTEIYTLSLHDALPILLRRPAPHPHARGAPHLPPRQWFCWLNHRSEEHTPEPQSHLNLVCRLLLEKKPIAIRFSHPSPITPRPPP